MWRWLGPLCLLLPSLAFAASETTESWQWYSDKPREVKPLLADPREAQVRMGFLSTGNGRSFLDIGLGGHIGIVRREKDDETFSLMGRAHIAARFQYHSKSFDNQNNDFIGGAAGSYRFGPHALEVFLRHQSSHLGDDLVAQGNAPLNFSYEALRLLYSCDLSLELRGYWGVEVKARAEPERLRGQVTVIFGGDWHFWRALPALFAAADLRFRQENGFGPNSAFLLGYELGDLQKVLRRQRLFLEVFNGHSNMGQFEREKEFSITVGFGANI